MNYIRFFYKGKDLKEGKRYLKPTKEYGYSNIESILKDYKTRLKHVGMRELIKVHHAGRCPALNRINNTGWVSFNNKQIVGTTGQPLAEIFENYPKSDEYVITKTGTDWEVNIPDGHYLLTIPTLYDNKEWFSLPGIIDPAYLPSYNTSYQLNAFIVMRRNQVIEADSPICQWILVKKESVEIKYELMNDDDRQCRRNKKYMDEMKIKDFDKYKELKGSELFRDGD